MRRITKAALGGLAGCALILGATQSAGGVAGATTYTFAGPLRDLQTTDGAFDSATAVVKITETAGTTTYWIRVRGIDPDAEGQLFGAHLHTGPCIEGNGGAAGPHYNHGGAPTLEENEVWFDLVPDENGIAVDETTALFVPEDVHGDQIMSIVIHQEPTNDTGGAGLRDACLPLDFSDDDQ